MTSFSFIFYPRRLSGKGEGLGLRGFQEVRGAEERVLMLSDRNDVLS